MENTPLTPVMEPLKRPVRRIKFDRWLFDNDLSNVEAARILGVHPMSIGRWRKHFDDPSRPIPPTKTIRDIERVSGGAVRFEDWDRPCDVAYVTASEVFEATL